MGREVNVTSTTAVDFPTKICEECHFIAQMSKEYEESLTKYVLSHGEAVLGKYQLSLMGFNG